MKTFASWKVAAAILISEGEPLKYALLTKKVLNSSLSKLGKRGGKTPKNTLNRIMNQTHSDKFINNGAGEFWIKDTIKQDSGVKEVLSILRQHEDSEQIKTEEDFYEGEKKWKYATYYERHPKLREEAIRIHGTTCMVPNCNFNFYEKYGSYGKEFIEVHHVKPLSKYFGNQKVDPKEDMVVVCSNCHRMIHRKSDSVRSLKEVDEFILKSKNE